MTLIMLGTLCSGALATKLLLMLDVTNLTIRYPLAVLLSYLVFYGCIKLWLIYITPASPQNRSFIHDAIELDLITPGYPLYSGSSPTSFHGSGGDFSGAGATGGWDAPPAGQNLDALVELHAPAETISLPIETSDSGIGDALGSVGDVGDEGGAIILAGIVLAIVLLAIFGVAGYFIYHAPVILTEVAFQGVMVAMLRKRTREMAQGNWMGSVLQATWKHFLLVLGMALMFGLLMHAFFPHATRLADLWK